MKFDKQFSAYVETQRSLLPGVSNVEFKRLKKLLKHCPFHGAAPSSTESHSNLPPPPPPPPSSSSTRCPECDNIFFPVLMMEMADVLDNFNARVRRLLDIHLASGFQKYVLRLKYKSFFARPSEMFNEGKNLASYVSMNAMALKKILKKYDKVHASTTGQAFKSQLQTNHVELLQSPWLVELIAFHMNLKDDLKSDSEIASRCAFDFDSPRPTLSFLLSDAIKLEVSLTCPICLELVFDPVSLRCGHMFCYSCVCSAASVSPVEGLRYANKKSKCPLCREENINSGDVRLVELNMLIRTWCRDYWDKRLQEERKERLQQIKQHWNQQCQAALGF